MLRRGEDPVGIVGPNVLMKLHEVDAVGEQTRERLLELRAERLFGSAVELGHQKDAVAVAV
jgi:hypothetical protein